MAPRGRPLRYPIKKLIAFNQQTLDAVEAFRKSESPIPSENEAIRQIINAWLEENDYLKP